MKIQHLKELRVKEAIIILRGKEKRQRIILRNKGLEGKNNMEFSSYK